jgi:hypothetical protein
VTSTDRSGREAIISCGAALDHFRVAMAAVGWDTNVEQFPNPNDLAHLASIDFASLDYVTQARRDRAMRYCVAGPTDYRSCAKTLGVVRTRTAQLIRK